MKCSNCGKEYSFLLFDSCPYCKDRNDVSLFDTLFSDNIKDSQNKKKKDSFDIYDWNNFENCSDKEFEDDDDYDDFDE